MCHDAPMSDLLWELAEACWRTDSTMRPTMEDVLASLQDPGFEA
jgi:hypothetical protein